MVHTRNGSKHLVQQDGCGEGRGKTKSRSVKSSSSKTHLEDGRVSPHSPRSVPITFDVNSESRLIHDNILRAEPLKSGRNTNLSIPIQKLVQSSQRRGVGSMPKPLAGGHELLLTHQELSGSGEDHRTLMRLEPIVLQRQGQKDKEVVEEPKSIIHRPKEGTGNYSSFGSRGPSGVYQLQTSSRSVQRQAQRTSEETERSQEPSRQGKRQSQLAQTLPIRVQDSQVGAFSHGQCVQYGQDSPGIYSQGAGMDEKNISTQIIDEIHFSQSNIDVKTGKHDAKLTKITLDINDLKKNDKQSAEMHKSVITTLDLYISTLHLKIDAKMVHTRIGNNYLVQLDGCGQGRGKTKSRSFKSSSRKTHLEDAKVASHSPRSVPTNFDVNSESELIHNNILSTEPLSSGRNRNLSIPIQKLVWSSQRRGVGNMSKPLAGGHELLLTLSQGVNRLVTTLNMFVTR
ncbi:hypothetical protein O181_117445 [Austropuccinia psidii MF-1]|uniref:Uncharacterized protein n=1 Tax=Austropuccinia psidii MF-1 TaxID=1389203 RepID=A0A9Q3PYE2_9BASI|nr:hypothetical protein [Austropuccinia psidii MF-1]